MKQVWELDWRDKVIHRHMSFAQTQLRKVARALDDYKDGDWRDKAHMARGGAETLETWMNKLKKESEVKP